MKKALILLICAFCALEGNAQTNYKMHSVFIYTFTRHVQWPDEYNTGDFEILVLGETPLLEELKTMAQSKKVGERNIKVTKIASTNDVRKCNILVVPANQSSKLAEVMAKVKNQSILIVTEETGLGEKGSDINFIVKDGKLRFELNQNAISRQNLRVSTELTRLAILI